MRHPERTPRAQLMCRKAKAEGEGSTRATNTRQQQQGAETPQAPNATQGPSTQWPPTRWRARNQTKCRTRTDPVGHEHNQCPMGRSAPTAISPYHAAVGNELTPIVKPIFSYPRRRLPHPRKKNHTLIIIIQPIAASRATNAAQGVQ